MSTKMEIGGVVRVWGLTKEKREYVTVENTFGEARLIYKSDPYSALTGKGEQRGIIPNHAKVIKKEMLGGTFTPTAVHVGVRPRHAKALKYETLASGVRTASLVLDKGDTLPMTNGGHRFEALGQIRQEAERAVKDATDDADREAAQAFLELVDSQPITATFLLNGSTQTDFINLQKGKNVDAAHMLSLRVSRSVEGDKDAPAFKLAFNVAKVLHSSTKSVFNRMIRFDSKGTALLPISTLCSKGASDQGTSLLGLAKIGLLFGPTRATSDWLSSCVMWAVDIIKVAEPKLLAYDKVLTPPPDGTKGSATMLIGLGVALAYRMGVLGEDVPSERTRASLVEAARETMDRGVNGNFSGPAKRSLLGEFVKEFFADVTTIEKHEGLPLGLVTTLSPSAFGGSSLPKQAKPRAAAKHLPDVDGPVAGDGRTNAA